MKLRKGSENWRNTWGWSGEKQVEDEEVALGVDLSNAKIHVVINLYKTLFPELLWCDENNNVNFGYKKQTRKGERGREGVKKSGDPPLQKCSTEQLLLWLLLFLYVCSIRILLVLLVSNTNIFNKFRGYSPP